MFCIDFQWAIVASVLVSAVSDDFVEVQRSGLQDASSHENDGSKYLKHDQIVHYASTLCRRNCAPTFQHSASAELAVGRQSGIPTAKRLIDHLISA